MKPTKLPKDWIVVTSQSHQNRVYYFNVKTNQSSWETPVEEPNNAGTSSQETKGKKRKNNNANDDGPQHRPTTPDLEAPKKAKGAERPMLRAKRIIASSEDRDPRRHSIAASGSKETPQMRELREKMLERQAKGNAVKKSKVSVATPPPVAVEKPEKPTSSSSEILQSQHLTPQMRVVLENMKAKNKAKGGSPKSPRNRLVKETNPEPQAGPMRRPRTRSLTPSDASSNNSATRTRRSSRSIVASAAVASTSNNCTSVKEEDVVSDNLYCEPSVVISRLSPNAVKDATKSSPRASPRVAKTPTAVSTASTAKSPEKAKKTPRLGRSAILKKNLAEERLANLQRSFGEDSVVDGAASIRSQLTDEDDDNSPCKVPLPFAKVANSMSSIYNNAEARAKFLYERINNKSLYEKRMAKTLNVESLTNRDADADDSATIALNTSDSFYEEMDWEPIEDEKIMQEIQAVRSHIGMLIDAPTPKEVPQNSLDLTDGPSRVALYIVVDTNVFLSNVEAIEEARDAQFKIYGRPLIVIPWTVIRELDFIKDDKSMTRPESLRAKARKAVRFLHQHFSAKHPRILGQTPKDVANNRNLFDIDCPDDEILQTCLQIKNSRNRVVLLSYDKNLCNKAMIHDIFTLGRDDPLEKVDYIHASEANNGSLLTQHLLGIERDPNIVPLYVKEAREAAEIFEEAKELLTEFLTVVVTRELQNLYQDHWQRYISIRPPWNVYEVLKCAIKHWIAAVSEAFHRRVEPLLRQLLEIMQKAPESARRLTDVLHILELIFELLQSLKVQKYDNMLEHSKGSIKTLKTKCMTAMRNLEEERLRDTIGTNEVEAMEEINANRAFQQFEEVYAFARDMCGLASEVIGMSCPFPFKKINPRPSVEDIKEMQPDVAANLTRLLQILSTALEELNGLHADHRAVIALYNALSNFKPVGIGELPHEFSALDVYCCLKRKHSMLKSGLDQLQELSSHFCRMASFRCK